MPQLASQSVDAVARTYAKALFDLAESKGQLEAVEADLHGLAKLWAENADFGKLMSSRVIGADQRAGMIDRMFQGRVEGMTYRFLQVLSHNSRGDKLPGVATAFDELMDEKLNRLDVTAYVSTPLDASELQRVRDQISSALNKDVQLSQETDESLIGGLKLRIGDQLIDGSVAAQLRRVKAKMLEAGEAKKREIIKD